MARTLSRYFFRDIYVEIQTVSQPAQATPEPSLEGLFAPRSNSKGPVGRHAGAAALPSRLAGDWTRTELPSTMESAAESGRRAVEAVRRYLT